MWIGILNDRLKVFEDMPSNKFLTLTRWIDSRNATPQIIAH